MCLILTTNYKQPSKVAPKKIYYKVYTFSSDRRSCEFCVKPIYFYNSLMKISVNEKIKSNRSCRKLTETELRTGEVHKGIHVFNSLKSAKNFTTGSRRSVIIEVIGHEFVAENFDNDQNQSVFMSITPVRVKAITDWSGRFRPIAEYVHKLLTI